MAKRLNFDVNGNVEDFTYVLSSRNFRHLGQLNTATNVVYKKNLNAADEISLSVYKQLDNVSCYVWDQIKNLKLLYIVELDEYFEIDVSMEETDANVKQIQGTSLCEAELGQLMLYDIEINTESDILRDEYLKPTIFYNEEEPENSLLNRLLEKAPHYKIGEVDETLKKIQRSFSINEKSIYDTLTSTIADEIDCLFLFDSATRTISAYDLETTCNKCGKRGEFTDVCPDCGSTSLTLGYGKDTAVYISRENLASQITVEADKDSVKNAFKLEAGDDLMTATIRNCLPNGSGYLVLFGEDQQEDMSAGLISKMAEYQTAYEGYENEYKAVMEEIYECIDDTLYYRSSMMPTVKQGDTDVTTEAAKLTAENLSPLAVTKLTDKTSLTTINNALKNYARIYVYSRYQIDAVGKSLTYNASTGTAVWTGYFTLTNYGDSEDKASTETISVEINTDYETFLEQKIKKLIQTEDETGESTIYDVLNIEFKEPDTLFNDAIKLYSLVRLTSFQDAIQGILDLLEEEKQENGEAEVYDVYYAKYKARLDAVADEMSVRNATLDEINERYKTKLARQNEIQTALNLETFLGPELWLEYSSYRREDTYSNDNYVSDGLSNEELFANAEEFIEKATVELEKATTFQYSLTTTMNNLLAVEEFAPIVDHFEVGNWIRVEADDEIYRLRLVSYQINFEELQTITVEFSDVTKTFRTSSDLESIASKVSNMSTNYSYIARQSSINENNLETLVEKFTTSDEVQKALKVLVQQNFDNLTSQIVTANKEIDELKQSNQSLTTQITAMKKDIEELKEAVKA